MTTDTFHASVQYGDLKGTSAADRADQGDADDWLVKNGLKNEGEFLLGIDLFAGENHGVHKDPVHVSFLLATAGNYDTIKDMIDSTPGPIPVRRVAVEMPIAEFFGLFKRFSITLSPGGMLEGKDYSHP